MRINLKKVSRRIYGYGKQKALPVLLATTLAVNSALAGMPVFNVAEAEDASVEIYNINLALSDDRIYVEFSAKDYQNVESVKVELFKDDELLAKNNALQNVIDYYANDVDDDVLLGSP